MSFPSLTNLSDAVLLNEIKLLREKENQVLADVILHLYEIDSRGIYRDAGYSSLFSYCRECLGYSESSAVRRIRAARCLGKSPEIYQLIRDGKLSLCAISEVSTVMTEENKADVLSQTQGASKRQAELIAVQFGAPQKPKQERITPRKVIQGRIARGIIAQSPAAASSVLPPPPAEERYVFSFEVTKKVRELFEEARKIAGHVPIAEIFERAVQEYVEKHRPNQAAKRERETKSAGYSRYIAVPVRREVMKREGGQCTYVSPEGKRCSERCGLQFDHIAPYAVGGKSAADNLRLLCPAHNQLHAERCFGRDFITSKKSQSDLFSAGNN